MRDMIHEAVNASVAAARRKGEEERARLLTAAREEAARVVARAEAKMAEADEMARNVSSEKASLESEKASMANAHGFQKSKILLNVGGHRFETSRQTLVSVPDSYFASMFSGRFQLTPSEDDGSYFIDRDGTHFRHTLNLLRDPQSFIPSSDFTPAQRAEFESELRFYGLHDRLTINEQEHVARGLVKRAYLAGTKHALETAVAHARTLVFEMRSEGAPFLKDEFQNSRWVITDRTLNDAPVWRAERGEMFMFRTPKGALMVGPEDAVSKGIMLGCIKTSTCFDNGGGRLNTHTGGGGGSGTPERSEERTTAAAEVGGGPIHPDTPPPAVGDVGGGGFNGGGLSNNANADADADADANANAYGNADAVVIVSPSEIPADGWLSNSRGTLQSVYASAEALGALLPNAAGLRCWARVPRMRVTAVRGLGEDDPTMEAALQHLAEMH